MNNEEIAKNVAGASFDDVQDYDTWSLAKDKLAKYIKEALDAKDAEFERLQKECVDARSGRMRHWNLYKKEELLVKELEAQNRQMREALITISQWFQGKSGHYREQDMKNKPEFFKVTLEQFAANALPAQAPPEKS